MKRFYKLTAWLLTLAMLMTFMPGFTLGVNAATELTDSVTNVTLSDSDEDGYYEISTTDELEAFANLVNDGNDLINVELTGDIDMTGKEWQMIVFGGTIDGNNCTISNLNFVATNVDGEQYAGLIYAYDATVKNISFENCQTVITSETSSERDAYAAIIAPVAIGGVFEKCSLVDCTVTQSGTASGFSYAGSIAGLTAYGLKITDCSVEGCIVTDDSESADGSFAGGLAGGFWAEDAIYDFGVQVKNNYIDADVTATNSLGVDAASGLICSVLDDSLAIVEVYDNCTVKGTITAEDVAAGLIGDCCGYDVTISNCTVLCDTINATYGDPFVYGEWAQKGEHDYYTATYSDLKIAENTDFVCNQSASSLGKYYLSDLYVEGEWDTEIVSFADFEPDVIPATYTVSATASPAEGGTVAGGGTYEADASVTVTATPNDGYAFDGWYEDGIYKSSDASYTFAASADRVLVAKFAKMHTVTFNANNGTDDTDSESVADGNALTLTNDVFTYGKCEIESWNTEADGSGDIYYADDDIPVTEDITLYAQWVLPLNKLEAFSEDDLAWSGNASAPYTFTMKNGTVLYAGVLFPSQSNEDKTTITVDDDCEIKGSVSFVSGAGSYGSRYRSDLTIKGDGALQFYELKGTGSGDTFTVETDVTITSDYMFIGASGGMDSKFVIKDATLTLHDLTLLQYLTMEGEAKLNIIGGTASFHGNPEITLSDKSEIYIGGNGYDCVLYKESGANDAFDALVSDNWLPEGYSFKEEGGYYLYDAEDKLALDAITIKKKQSASSPASSGSSGGVTTRYTVRFETNGGSSVASKTVTRNRKIAEPTAPVKDGFAFGGWYTDKALTDAYDFDLSVTKNFTLYAKWNEAETGNEDANSGGSGHNCPSLRFDDLDITKWYHPDTDYVIEKDIFRGTTETTFTPDGNITRAMMITVLYRAEGEPEVTGKATFEDIDENAYYAKAVVWGQQNGIIKGYSEAEYAPMQDILREQIAAIMHRYAKFKGIDVSVGENTNILSYDDFAQISEYAIASMQWAVGSGMIKGRTESTLNPDAFATRVEIAAMLHRFIEANK